MSRSDRAVFRLPGVSLIIPFLLFICVTPLATVGAKIFLLLYVLPAGGLAYILLTRTVADPGQIRTTGLLGGRRLAWSELDGLEFHGPRWAIAVGTDGRRVRLPMVRPRDLPRLARVSGGRLLLGADAPSAEAPTPDAPTPDDPTLNDPTLDDPTPDDPTPQDTSEAAMSPESAEATAPDDHAAFGIQAAPTAVGTAPPGVDHVERVAPAAQPRSG